VDRRSWHFLRSGNIESAELRSLSAVLGLQEPTVTISASDNKAELGPKASLEYPLPPGWSVSITIGTVLI
jgi:hypothetical protein